MAKCLALSVAEDRSRRLEDDLNNLRAATIGYDTGFLKTYENLIATALHHQGKTFTTQIESLHLRFRHYLARLHSRTLCYSKSKRMLEISLKRLVHKLNNA